MIGANRNARRAAVAHMLFNVLGTTIMYGLFYIQWHGRPVFLELVNSLTGGDSFAGENLSRQVANANTLFKVVFLDMVANIEKVGDHLTNIAQAGKGLLGEPDEG